MWLKPFPLCTQNGHGFIKILTSRFGDPCLHLPSPFAHILKGGMETEGEGAVKICCSSNAIRLCKTTSPPFTTQWLFLRFLQAGLLMEERRQKDGSLCEKPFLHYLSGLLGKQLPMADKVPLAYAASDFPIKPFLLRTKQSKTALLSHLEKTLFCTYSPCEIQ